MPDAFDLIELEPKDVKDVYKSNPNKDAFDEVEYEESWGKNLLRTLFQIPSGIAQGVTYPLDLLQMFGLGEGLDEEDIERLEKISERENIPFNRDEFLQNVYNASEAIPTQGNIERSVEERTGIPLTPRTGLQKGIKLGSMAGKVVPGTLPQRGLAAITAPTVSKGLQETGLPESISDIVGLGAAGIAGVKAPKGISEKPSGMVERGFESLKKPVEVSEKKLSMINEKLQNDFTTISDRIISESPVGETAYNLKNDPSFRSDSRELLNQAQALADEMSGNIPSREIKKELSDLSKRNTKGFSLSEYDKNYKKYLNEKMDDIIQENITPGEFVQQYRKNNKELAEYFEPGASKSLNRAKRDAILDSNRAIANVMEKSFPDSELVPVFKEGNARWTRINDVEAIDELLGDIFGAEKIDYKNIHKFFEKEGYDRVFKRSLGQDGFREFEQLMKDMLSSETPYKMLKVAKDKGYDNLYKTGLTYILHPKVAATKIGYDIVKNSYKSLMNSMLDKPRLVFGFQKSISNLKKGKFGEAEKDFNILEEEILSKEAAAKKWNERQKDFSSRQTTN